MKSGYRVVGHPVDVASGTVYSFHEDIAIPGKVNLVWERRYSTAPLALEMPPTPLGPGWTTRFFVSLKKSKNNQFEFITPEGSPATFDDPEGQVDQGGFIRNPDSFQEISKRDGRYVITQWDVDTGEVERYIFTEGVNGKAWPLTSIEDITGQGLDLTYDLKGRLIKIQQRLEKRALVLSYTVLNQIDAVTLTSPADKSRVLVRYQYNASGLLSAAYNALGYGDHYQYDMSFRMVQETRKNGGMFFFKYDEKGRCVRTSGLDDYDEKVLSYLDDIGWTEVKDSHGQVTRYQRRPNGQIIQETDPLAATKQTSYDEHGRIVSKTYPSGAKVEYSYDEKGNRSKVIDPLGSETVFTYNDDHQILSVTDAAGNLWRRTYDTSNQLTGIQDPQGNKWGFTYDNAGNVVSITNPQGRSAQRVYGANGDLLEATGWDDYRTRFKTDAMGRLTEEIDPLDKVTHIRYDLAGNVQEITCPEGSRIKCRYDPGNNLISLTRPDGQTIRYEYDGYDRLVAKIDPLGERFIYEWGSEPEQLEAIVDQNGKSCRFDYDESQRLIREVGFDGRIMIYEYDASQNCIAMTNGNNERLTYAYDLMGQLIEQALPDGTSNQFQYDACGNLTSAVNPDCEVTFEYDVLGRIVKENQGDHVIEHSYHPTGDLVQLKTDLGLNLRYTLGPNGNPSRLSINGQHLLEFIHNARGEEVSRILPGELTLKQMFDGIGRMSSQQLFSPNEASVKGTTPPLLERTYHYSKGGNLAEIQDSRTGLRKYFYDSAERLIQTIRENGEDEQFAYDPTGNITHIRKAADEPVKLTYVSGALLRRCGDTEYEYDNNGRLICKTEDSEGVEPKEWHYSWDANDQLRSLKAPNGDEWTYTYDALGRRIAKKGPYKIEHFVWDRGVVIHQLKNEVLDTTWVFDSHNTVPLCTLQKDQVLSLIPDHLGTPQELVDMNARIVWSGNYFAWGCLKEEKDDQQIDCPLRFQGQWYDPESGLHYNRFRYYNPEIGRFISQDPLGLVGSKHLYTYAPNPIEWSDPLGLVASPANISSGLDAPEVSGVFAFSDSLGNHFIGMAHSYKLNMTRYLAAEYLEPGETIRALSPDSLTKANGQPRSTRGARRIRELLERQNLWVELESGISKSLVKSTRVQETALVTQALWQNRDFSLPYFD